MKTEETFSMYLALFTILSSLIISSLVIFPFGPSFQFLLQSAKAQGPITLKDLVTYSRESSFIKEFTVPLSERGLKGITTDSQGNAWFYHSTDNASTIIKLDISSNKFTQYNVRGNTTADKFIINLAGGQILYDNSRNIIWFTDARTNSIGKLYASNTSSSNNTSSSSKVELFDIPTPKAGPMGIVLSPDRKTIWIAEITGDKIASLDTTSNKITEYPTGENTGPTFLTFDNSGVLWVTMSYSHNILRVEPWALIPGRTSFGMSYITLPKQDTFSPFGIAIVGGESSRTSAEAKQKIFFSDHGSSRVVSSLGGDIDSNPFQQQSSSISYVSYWTSPSQVYPTTLPGQIVKDKIQRNIYFPEHGGNRIAKINVESGEMTEYDIPTGPLSTTIFIALSDDGKKVWFTEWASNKVAYLDTTIPIPFNMKVAGSNNNSSNSVNNWPITLKPNESKTIEVLLNPDKNGSVSASPSSSLSLSEVEIAVIGMSDSGLRGLTYTATPQRINMQQYPVNKSQITLSVEQDQARPDQYTAMIKASASEKRDPLLFVSLLYPIPLTLNVPITGLVSQQQQNSFHNNNNNNQNSASVFNFNEPLRSIIRILALPIAISLIGYTIYGRIKRSKREGRKQQQER
jgi:virginiamycin B lyase